MFLGRFPAKAETSTAPFHIVGRGDPRLDLIQMSGILSGIAALVFLARVNAADSGMGEPLLLPVIASVLIGGTSLFGGVGSLLGTVLGAVLLALVINGMNLLDVPAQWQPLVVGAVLLAAVLVDLVGRRGRERVG